MDGCLQDSHLVRRSAAQLRYLWAFTAADDWVLAWHERLLGERIARGFDVANFCVSPPSLSRRWLPFYELDQRWKDRDPCLLKMYGELEVAMEDRDVLVLYNGANLHPDFAAQLPSIRVFTCGDDPESTDVLSRPVAPVFDIHLVNNVACVDMYAQWGLDHVHHWPLGSLSFAEDVPLDEESIQNSANRPIPIVLVAERESPYRRRRFDRLARSFPQATFYGRGWPNGFVPWPEVQRLYLSSQIGWNIHNSIGPVNFRTYELPAYGVLQICDNKTNLDHVFVDGEEIIGFDNIRECKELTRYYLKNPEEQRSIAAAGWRRWLRDYTPERVWDRLIVAVDEFLVDRGFA